MNEDLSKLNLVELLDRLAPIPEPPAVSMVPQTQGWIWLGVLLAAIAGWLVYRWLRTYRADAYRRRAMAELAAAGGDPVRIAGIVRRTALQAFPRQQVAGLHGDAWLAFLDGSYRGKGFADGAGRAVASAPYDTNAAIAGLDRVASDWIRHHRRPAGGPA